MSASLVGSEMCIRDRAGTARPSPPTHSTAPDLYPATHHQRRTPPMARIPQRSEHPPRRITPVHSI
eukprot:3869171-Alexandrium_andersonii.AAC.1